MKTFKNLIVFCVLGLLSVYHAQAVCIGCGCNRDYRDCVANGNFDCPKTWIDLTTGEPITADPQAHSGCCGVGLRNCHEGFGIGTRWFGPYGGTTIPTEPGYIPIDYNDIQGGLYVAFSVNGNIFGSHEGGQVIKPYHLLNQAELNQIAHLQPIINKYLNGIVLTQEEINLID